MLPAIDTSSPAFLQARRQAEELEGVFLTTLVKQMTSAIDTDGPFGGGFGEETWRSMQAEQLAQSMAEAGGIGLADSLVRDILAMNGSTGGSVGASTSAPATPMPHHAISAYHGASR